MIGGDAGLHHYVNLTCSLRRTNFGLNSSPNGRAVVTVASHDSTSVATLQKERREEAPKGMTDMTRVSKRWGC